MTNTIKHTFYLRAIQISDFSTSTQKKFFLIARASDLFTPNAQHIHKTVLPLDANLREPSDKNCAVKSILTSIKKSLFHEISSPIHVCAMSATLCRFPWISGGEAPSGLCLEFKGNDGVLDGGHRLFALWKAKNDGLDLSNVRVSFIVTSDQLESSIIDKCLELNTYHAPTKFSLIDKAGGFDHIKPLYKTAFPLMRYYDNESGTSDHLFATIKASDGLIRRSAGYTKMAFDRKNHRGSQIATNKNRGDLFVGIEQDLGYWKHLFVIHPVFEYLLELLAEEAKNKTCRFFSPSIKPFKLANGRTYQFNLSSVNIPSIFMSCLSMNFDKDSKKWRYNHMKVAKVVFPQLITEFKKLINQTKFYSSASQVCGNKEFVDRMHEKAENIYSLHFVEGLSKAA